MLGYRCNSTMDSDNIGWEYLRMLRDMDCDEVIEDKEVWRDDLTVSRYSKEHNSLSKQSYQEVHVSHNNTGKNQNENENGHEQKKKMEEMEENEEEEENDKDIGSIFGAASRCNLNQSRGTVSSSGGSTDAYDLLGDKEEEQEREPQLFGAEGYDVASEAISTEVREEDDYVDFLEVGNFTDAFQHWPPSSFSPLITTSSNTSTKPSDNIHLENGKHEEEEGQEQEHKQQEQQEHEKEHEQQVSILSSSSRSATEYKGPDPTTSTLRACEMPALDRQSTSFSLDGIATTSCSSSSSPPSKQHLVDHDGVEHQGDYVSTQINSGSNTKNNSKNSNSKNYKFFAFEDAHFENLLASTSNLLRPPAGETTMDYTAGPLTSPSAAYQATAKNNQNVFSISPSSSPLKKKAVVSTTLPTTFNSECADSKNDRSKCSVHATMASPPVLSAETTRPSISSCISSSSSSSSSSFFSSSSASSSSSSSSSSNISSPEEFDTSIGSTSTNQSMRSRTVEFGKGTCKVKPVFRGVSCCGKDRKFQARIRSAAGVFYLGRFNTEIEAAFTYDDAARTHKGPDSAACNFDVVDSATRQRIIDEYNSEGFTLFVMSHLAPLALMRLQKFNYLKTEEQKQAARESIHLKLGKPKHLRRRAAKRKTSSISC